jgi:hypothetical protein
VTTQMVTPAAARASADKVYVKRFARWAVHLGDVIEPPLAVSLRPPGEAVALREPSTVAAWIAAWRDTERAADGVEIDWETRRWASMGTQQLPVRLRLSTPDAVARFAQRSAHWRVATARAALLREALSNAGDARAALVRVLPVVTELADDDINRLAAVVTWLVKNTASGMFVRQLPVRGVDTKWIERHRSVVTALVTSVTGAEDLGLATRPSLVRLRFCDPSLAPARIADLAAPMTDLARLSCAPRHIVVVENLETLLALPALPGVVAVHGQGYAASALGEISWIAGADVVYWGDLDTDGFNILSIARRGVPHVRSVLMDRSTIAAHIELAVPDPKPRRSFAGPLTLSELDAVEALREAGDIRLEQERIPWDTACRTLRRALALKGTSDVP